MSQLKVCQLEKSFKSRMVVKDVSLHIKKGECVGLLGPNGAGKTTCFYMIVGLQSCDKGIILLNGQDITKAPMHQRARLGIGYLPQEASVFRKLTVSENILAVLQLRKELSEQDISEKLTCYRNSIQHLSQTLGMALSGGERRRVEIARALAMEPSFILLDEPFAGVDLVSVKIFKVLSEQLCNRGIGNINYRITRWGNAGYL